MEFKRIEGLPDYAALIDLINAEWPPQFGQKSDAEKIEDMINSHNTEKDQMAVLYDGGTAVGFYRFTSWPRSARATNTVHTYDISVLPARQKQGIGSTLMKDMLNVCRSMGYEKLLSRSFRDNEASIRLHKRFGFRNSMETEDSIVWELVLT